MAVAMEGYMESLRKSIFVVADVVILEAVEPSSLAIKKPEQYKLRLVSNRSHNIGNFLDFSFHYVLRLNLGPNQPFDKKIENLLHLGKNNKDGH